MRYPYRECFTCAIDPPGYCAVRSVLVWRARDHTTRPNEPVSASECATALAGRRVQSTSAAAARDGVWPEPGDAADGALLLCAQDREADRQAGAWGGWGTTRRPHGAPAMNIMVNESPNTQI